MRIESEKNLIFHQKASLIRKYGYVFRGFQESDSFTNYSNEFRIDIPKKKIVITLKDSDFSHEISVSYSDLLESRNLKINSINESFIKSERTTQEHYGMVHQTDVDDNLKIITELLDDLDDKDLFHRKIINSFESAFNIVFKSFNLFGLLEQYRISNESKRKIKEEAIERIMRFSKNRIKVKTFIDCETDFENIQTSILEIKEIIEKSTNFKDKQYQINKFLSYNMNLIIEENSLYLYFKENSFFDNVKGLFK